MAKATIKTTGVVVTLELTEAEAEYVLAALVNVEPSRLDSDTVYDALTDAGVEYVPDALA